MNDPVSVSVRLMDRQVRFSGSTRSLPAIDADYFPPLGEGKGYTGLELLLFSLAVCSATSIVAMLRRMKKTVAGFRVNASGPRREQHPTCFSRIDLDFILVSPDGSAADMEKAIQASEQTFCPVWAMLKGNVEIVPTFTIVAG